MEQAKIAMLSEKALEIRLGALKGVYHAASGHPGGSLSISDLLAYLYFEEMNIDPKDPKKADRDRFVLSKGHTAPALYAALAARGYFDPAALETLRHIDSFLQGHPDMKHTPGVDMSSGSLGLGISAACGMAISAKLIPFLAMVNPKKVRFGKQLCLQRTISLIIFALSSTGTVSRSTVRFPKL